MMAPNLNDLIVIVIEKFSCFLSPNIFFQELGLMVLSQSSSRKAFVCCLSSGGVGSGQGLRLTTVIAVF